MIAEKSAAAIYICESLLWLSTVLSAENLSVV
jgi:hypothetical protein